MRRGGNLEQAPGLVDADVADDFRRMDAGIGVARVQRGVQRRRQIVDGGTVPHRRIVETDAGGDAVAELRRVLDVVGAGTIAAMAPQQEGRVVARITLPGRRVGGRRLAEGESRELDEEIIDGDIAAAGGVEQVRVADRGIHVNSVRVEAAAAQRGEREFGRTKGADHAIFGGGTGINRQHHARARDEIIEIAVPLPGIAIPRRLAVRAAAVEGDVGTHIAAELDAGIAGMKKKPAPNGEQIFT